MWYTFGMAPTSKSKQILPNERAARRRARLELRRQARLMAQHPDNDAIDIWIEAAYDWSEWS